MKRLAVLMTVMLGVVPIASFAAGNVQAGKKKSAQCASCHGKKGVSQSAQFPVLAGQHRDYLVLALKRYRSKKRKNGIMNGMASSLSDQDIQDLAAYYAAQRSPLYEPSERR